MTWREFQLEPSALEDFSMNPDDLGRIPVGAECVGNFSMNPDNLERISVGAECIGRFFHESG